MDLTLTKQETEFRDELRDWLAVNAPKDWKAKQDADETWCQGFSEPNAGSDLAALRTDARREGDKFVVNGQKIWTSYGWAADWCALVVRSEPGSEKHKGLSYILVDMHSKGVDVR